MGRGDTTQQAYDPLLGTYIPCPTNTPSTEIKIIACIGASAALCGAAYRYYRYRTCMQTYGRDMTASAAKGDPVVGRDKEIERVVRILSRRTKNCAVLVGAAGVGKTAIAEGLAQRIASGTVPASLAGARVVAVDLAAMVAGTRWRGMFEERMKNMIKHAEAADGKIILFIDEMHMLIGAGDPAGSRDAANILKPALARGRIRCMGATTHEEYRKHVEKDPALERRFQKVHVQEPSTHATIAILKGIKERYQNHYDVEIPDDTIHAIVHLANRYITEGKAKSIVGREHIAQVLSQWTGIPMTKLDQKEKVRLINLADRLHERVIGQNEAVNLVAEAVLRSRAGLAQPGQPIGSFLFLGSTGVGKTELAKALAEQLFDSEKRLLRFDMSEYVCASSISRLIGAPPSYHGYHEGGQLTEKVRTYPYSVILFDEVEKADRSVLNVFLQLLGDGVLTDGKGQKVDFKNTIIIMTSNLGAEHLTSEVAGDNTVKSQRDLVMKQVRKYFKPELLNRLSDIVVFEPLSHHQLKEIVKIQMMSVTARVAGKGISLVLSDDVLDVILLESYNPKYGARPIGRWVEKNIVTVISKMLVTEEATEGSTISIFAADDRKGLKYQLMNKTDMTDMVSEETCSFD
ncbi:hypothetical protein ACQ4PT_030115 [Festuca glaucescens]